jgi:hypothetical protein
MINNKTNKSFGKFYMTWKAINARCSKKGHKNYSGRGISVSKDWKNFYLFHKDMYKSYMIANNKYDGKQSIERIDNNGNYCKENCKWIKLSDQSKNRRMNHKIYYKGKTMNLTDLSKKLNINYDSLRNRIIRKGLSVNESLAKPFRDRIIEIEQRTLDGRFIKKWSSIKEASINLKLDDGGISRAINNKISNCGGFMWIKCKKLY